MRTSYSICPGVIFDLRFKETPVFSPELFQGPVLSLLSVASRVYINIEFNEDTGQRSPFKGHASDIDLYSILQKSDDLVNVFESFISHSCTVICRYSTAVNSNRIQV